MAKMETEQRPDKLDFHFEPKEQYLDPDFCKQAAEVCEDEELTSGELNDQMDCDPGVYVPFAAHIWENGLIRYRTQKELARAVQRARDSGEAWAKIGARAGGLTEHRVQQLYEEATGDPYFLNTLGSGRPRADGRGFQGYDDMGQPIIGDEPLPEPDEDEESESEADDEASDESDDEQLVPSYDEGADADEVLSEITELIEGKTLTVQRPGGKTATLTIVSVEDATTNKRGNWGVKVQTDDDKTRAFALNKITEIS